MHRFLKTVKDYQQSNLKVINDKADKEEEFWINKIKHEAQEKDEEAFRKMENSVKVAEKIFKSRKINECRMSEMKVRFDMIEKVQNEAKDHLKRKIENVLEYKKLLKGLIMQSLIKLLEEKVDIRCIKSQEHIVREVMLECQREFNEICEVKT